MADVIKGLLGEQEFLYMDDETLAAFGSLIDDNIGMILTRYLSDPTSDPATVARIKDKLGAAIQTAVFSVDVDSDLDVVCKTSIELLGDINIDRTKVISKLSWLKDNKQYLRATIPPRQKAAFDTFVKGLSNISYPEGVWPSPRLTTVLKNNSMLFYKRNEKPRFTGLSYFATKSNEWEMKLLALLFVQYKQRTDGIEYILKDY